MMIKFLKSRLNLDLTEIEKQHNFQRWEKGSEEYTEMAQKHHSEALERVLLTLRSAVVQRQYLIELKAKYAGNVTVTPEINFT